MELLQKEPGSVVSIGDIDFVVLDHFDDGTTAVITKNIQRSMAFGENAEYSSSNVHAYCEGEFYNLLGGRIGYDNIIQHRLDLMADDGTNAGAHIDLHVSVLTTQLYRMYRRFLPRTGSYWWTATRVTTEEEYSRYVCFVDSVGALYWFDCSYTFGVRPFCLLNSSIFVS